VLYHQIETSQPLSVFFGLICFSFYFFHGLNASHVKFLFACAIFYS